MADRTPDFVLTEPIAKKIIALLGPGGDPEAKRATPTEICQEIGINRRTFNSAISKVVFAKDPTIAECMLRSHIMDIHAVWWDSLEYESDTRKE